MSASASSSKGQVRQLQLSEGLAASSLCHDLGAEALQALSGLARPKSYGALQEAVTEGQRAAEIELVTSGRFVVLLPSSKIDLHATGSFDLHLYLPGDCFGLFGLVDAEHASASASVIASEASTTIAIPVAGLADFLDTDDPIAAVVYRNLFTMQSRRLDALSA